VRLVVDSNQLQSPALREFLARSTSNFAVLPDFVSMEAYKGDTLNSIFKSMEIVSEFSAQVIVLKGSTKNFGMSGRRKGLQRRLIDEPQTRDFPVYARSLRLAQAGSTSLQREIIALGKSATEHFDKMLRDAQEMREVFTTLGKAYSKEERIALRDRQPYTQAMIEKLVATLLEIAKTMFRDSTHVRRKPSYKELPNTFVFRGALTCYVMGITRAAQGGLLDVRAEKLRNDLVDMLLVAYGTFFDGILSDDKAMNHIFMEACHLLSAVFNAEVPAMERLWRKSV
jgi:hypothetical protein